ncbi:aldose 1-epimerase [Rhizobium sp. BK312]|uniref:aldose 1-epimerase n=1 Tax=Rhizobium sp. BK312 TaxID=2587080 RepID=UPI000DD5FBBF|nr:aldose 1-epimerase [Rhizobium sp. BK312]MBB3424535.1 aldose 1-epimerase [Rhizobium sp. BK312]
MAVERIVLDNEKARLELVPALGGGIARLDVRIPGGSFLPALRPWTGREGDAFSLGSNVLVPFSNRISGGGFEQDGIFYLIPVNLPGEPLPIHGDGFQRRWRTVARRGEIAELECDGEIGPFRYRARQIVTLAIDKLVIDLTVQNLSGQKLPFGVGFHPWFPRNAGTRLRFRASEIWLEDERHLPAGRRKVIEVPDWDFDSGRVLPEGWINNVFGGWDRKAVITQGGGAVSLRIFASDNLDYALVYSPNSNVDFFCFEPVSHPVDAHNLDGRPGLQVLEHREELTASMTLQWDV